MRDVADSAAAAVILRNRRREGPMELPLQSVMDFGSIHFDSRGSDNWPPLLDLCPVESSERLWRSLVAWENLLPKVGQLPSYNRIVQRLDSRRVELANNVLRRAFGSKQRVPMRKVKT